MGNSKSKQKSSSSLNILSVSSKEEERFDIPSFSYPAFCADTKLSLKTFKKALNHKKPYDVIALFKSLELVVEPASNQEKAEGSNELSYSAPVWNAGVGYGGHSSSGVEELEKRLQLKKHQLEREYVLATGFDVITQVITSESRRTQSALRKCFNVSPVMKLIREYLNNDSLLDIAEHIIIYWYMWKMLVTLVSIPRLRAIFRHLYHPMRHFLKLASQCSLRMKQLSNQNAGSRSVQLIQEVISSEDTVLNMYQLYRSEKAGTAISSRPRGQTISQIDILPAINVQRDLRRSSLDERALTDSGNLVVPEPDQEPIVESSKCAETKLEPEQANVISEVPPKNDSPPKSAEDAKQELPLACSTPENQAGSPAKEKSRKKKKKSKRRNTDSRPEYVRLLAPLIFDSCKFRYHHYRSQNVSLGNTSLSRVLFEIQTLADSLESCLTEQTSIYLRTDTDSIHLMKALIIGPEETPYANGCFEFDICLPSSYPNAPPLVNLATTGGGSFRFNPNLYANGKVCLSLIGTWSGSAEEKWDPVVSTLFQVFISIQSLILVANPYYNEPGYQFSPNSIASDNYNLNIREGTARIAIIEQLTNADSSAFKDVIQTHFKLKKDQIRKQLTEWNDQNSLNQFNALIDKLEQ